MFRYFLVLIFVSTLASAEVKVEDSIDQNLTQQEIEKQNKLKISQYLTLLDEIELQISEEAVWMKSYSTYLTSLDVSNNLWCKRGIECTFG